MRISKLFMVALLKIYDADKALSKFCLKAIRDTFFQYVVYDQGKNRGLNFLVGVISSRK